MSIHFIYRWCHAKCKHVSYVLQVALLPLVSLKMWKQRPQTLKRIGQWPFGPTFKETPNNLHRIWGNQKYNLTDKEVNEKFLGSDFLFYFIVIKKTEIIQNCYRNLVENEISNIGRMNKNATSYTVKYWILLSLGIWLFSNKPWD